MQPLLALVTVRAISVVVVPGPEDGCPSARQVEAAMATRAPAVQRLRGLDPESTLSVILPAPGSSQEPSFSLIDNQGRLRLFRTLARPGSTRARDCVALSDTVALIVQRYLEEVELPAAEEAAPKAPNVVPKAANVRDTPPVPSPAPAPAPRPASAPAPAPAPVPPESRSSVPARLDLSLAFATRVPGDIGGLEPDSLRLSVARTFGARKETGLLGTAWAGISGWSSRDWTGGRGTLIRVPMGLGLFWRRTMSSVELQLGAGGLVDLWILRATYPDSSGESARIWISQFAVAGAAIAGLQMPLGKRFFARVSVDLAVAAQRCQFHDRFDPTPRDALAGPRRSFSTPLMFGDAAFALGMSLR